MQTRRNATLNQPVLIPIAGNYDRKPRSLDREVTTVGRARGSDLCLEANEISTLHCILYRTAEGYRIRDCNSRCGTRINGESVKTGLLHDGDIINVGPFSFEFHMPAALFPNESARLDPLRVEHWKESRRRLAQLALKMRNRLQGTSPREQEWAQKGHLLKEKIRCYDQRLGELEAAEEELAEERRQLAQETESHRGHVQSVEQQLAERLAQADQEIHQRWQEFQQRCQAEEARIANASLAQPAAPAEHVERELLRELEEQYQRRHEQLQRDQQEFATMKEQWVSDQTKLSAGMQEEQAALAQKKADLVRMMGDLKKMQENLRQQAKLDGRAAREEVERLRRENAELRAHFDGSANGSETQAILDENEQLRVRVQQLEATAGQASGNEVGRPQDDLRAEIELLREELQRKDSILADLSKPEGGGEDSLRAENALLKQLLEEKNRFLEELSIKSQHVPKTANDLERYEAELNDLRRELETDRTKLNTEVEMLRDRNKELDEAIREMEMEMSKERAELARERMRLERVREEVKADTERLQRELAVRDSMAPVQKLRDELAQKQATGGKAEKPLNDRLRGMRNQLTDGGPSGS
jgi:pSer/pThr/pTyr-binding forkhead associated (FHA) protein